MLAVMSRDARQLAHEYYDRHGRDIQQDMQRLSENSRALIIWLPQLIVLAMPVNHHHPERWSSLASTSPQDSDAWYVHLLIGDLALARELGKQVEVLNLLCFQRGLRSPRPHIHRFRDIIH